MPPTILVRPFQESLIESGRVTSNDNLMVRFQGMDFESQIESDDVVTVKWNIQWEIMLTLRDLRGHHAAMQTIETILFLLTDYHPIYSSRGMTPRGVDYTEFDEDMFRYWSIRFDVEADVCETPYCDPWEAAPKELLCVDDCTMFLGLNTDGEYNICWRRYQKPGENKWRYYNACGQREGDEQIGCWFADGTMLNRDYGNSIEGIKASLNGPPVPGIDFPFEFTIGLWRNTPDNFPAPDPEGFQGPIITKSDI